MKRFFMILLLTAALFITDHSMPASAAVQKVNLVMNGENRHYEEAAILEGGRVMLPIRYVAEDPALRGEVSWDAGNQTVTVDAGGHHITFRIGGKAVIADGMVRTIDTAAVIRNGRAYIPLRFLSETMGASVGWKARNRTVFVQFGPKPVVMGYYYMGEPGDLNHSSLTDAAFRWLETDAQGNIRYEYWNDQAGMQKRADALAKARQRGLKTHISVMMMGWTTAGRAELHQLLSSSDNRRNLIENLKNHAHQFDYDGINVDLEGIGQADRDNFVTFLQELHEMTVAEHLTLSVAIPARTKYSSWHLGYDYSGIGREADLVILMAYDYNMDEPIASAPINWVEGSVSYLAECVPREKILLGIGAYGRDWNLKSQTAKAVYQETLDAVRRSGIKKTYGFDKASYTPYIDYKDGSVRHRIWYENSASLGEKRAVALEYGLGGTAFWRLEGAFTDLYAVLGE